MLVYNDVNRFQIPTDNFMRRNFSNSLMSLNWYMKNYTFFSMLGLLFKSELVCVCVRVCVCLHALDSSSQGPDKDGPDFFSTSSFSL